MSKFFEALERAENEQARRTQASSPRPPADLFASPPLAAPSCEVAPPAPPLPEPPVFEPPPTATGRGVDRSNRVAEQLVSLLSPASFEAERYRVLRHAVETLRKSANLQVLAVTSPGVGDGKTTTAINLAGALAQSKEARVLLVDVDLRRPKVAQQLGLGATRRSLADALLEPGLTLRDTVEHLPRFNLSVLQAGSAVAFYELLKSPRLETLLEEARQFYDYVVLDTPPFVPVPDGRLIAKCADGFLIVVSAHRTPRGMLAEAMDLMDSAKVVGFVFNGDDNRRSSYYGYHDEYAGSSSKAPRRRPWRKS
jgi:capsular exopolysaccharide synthesis family protein